MSALGASAKTHGAAFQVWAPRRRSVDVLLNGRAVPLQTPDGCLYEGHVEGVAAGSRYRYRLDGGRAWPDPASRSQPEGVHGSSEVVDPAAFPWTDQSFRGHAPGELIIYELHVGAFTRAGTFEAVIPHLPALVDLGVTAVELMPVAEFAGPHGWGYDGVYLYAPHSAYGGPHGLRRLVDACHAAGLSVILDVVYNHLGPEGNYLGEFGPYFATRPGTPWGPGFDFDGPHAAPVRRHIVENARAWVREFHMDGLRLDAVHAIVDGSRVHILTELAAAAREEAMALRRPVHLIAESHDNDRRLVLAAPGGLGLDAVWSDDFHHALHARLTGERVGYYADFPGGQGLERAIAEGFAFQGEPSAYWGWRRGTPSADLEGDHFVISVQNHDQVGNRPGSQRLGALLGREAARVAAALLFAAPAIPLLFMGEEYGEPAPFPFFTSFPEPGLNAAVWRGRQREFERFGWTGPIDDPGDPATFERARLERALMGAPGHQELRRYYAAWLALRRDHPALGATGKARARVDTKGGVVAIEREAATGERVVLVANLTPAPQALPPLAPGARVLLDSMDPRFGGTGASPLGPHQALLFEGGPPQ